MRRQCIDGPAAIELAYHDGIVPRPMVHMDNSRHNPFRDIGPEQYPAAFVEAYDNVVRA